MLVLKRKQYWHSGSYKSNTKRRSFLYLEIVRLVLVCVLERASGLVIA